MSKKVMFLGDLYRGNQAENVERIHRLFSPVFRQWDIETFMHISDINRNLVMEEWLEEWRDSLACTRKSDLENCDLRNVSVIGFEMSDIDIRFLNQAEVSWANLAIHPIRFLADLYFEVTTSFTCDLKPHTAGDGLIEFHANVLRAKYKLVTQEKYPPTLAIFGQTPNDRSVYFDGGFHDLNDYLPKLDGLTANYERILFRPHPYLTNPEVDELIYERYRAKPCAGANVYEIFVNSGITSACSISSSVIAEASYFGIDAIYLDSRAKIFGPPVDYRLLIDNDEFWSTKFLGQPLSSGGEAISRAVPENYLRSTFGSWGYVTREQELCNQTAVFLDRIQQLETRMDQAGIKAADNESRTKQILERAGQIELRAEQAERALHMMQASFSWRMTAPFRGVSTVAGYLLSRSIAWLSFAPMSRPRRILRQALIAVKSYLYVRPRLMWFASRLLAPLPSLKERLKNVGVQPQALHGTRTGSNTSGFPIGPEETVAQLTPRARRIYAALKQAFEKNRENI
ncbi:MAG TPA: hypothetical protein VHO84_12335 [Syntrophorhabdaceae bacterium]|nr:hypothetical protein [Syntrophorhabdaceae bacterium]